MISGYRANVRDTDHKLLGVVSDRYRVVQNEDAFAFTDALLGEGVSPYLVFCNAHDGSRAIKVAMTPIRVVCSNMLNLASHTAKRCWSAKHTTNIADKLEKAKETLFFAESYMSSLGQEMEMLRKERLSDRKAMEYINTLLPMREEMTIQQKKNIRNLKEDLKRRYFDAPDLRM